MGLESMGDTPQNTGEGKEAASVREQTEEILNEFIKHLEDSEFSAVLAKLGKEFVADEVEILVDDIKTEHAEEREAADREQIEANEEVKAAECLQRKCDYVRRLCKLTFEHKRDRPEAIEAAKEVLELLSKIEKGDYRLWREMKDTLSILMAALRADNEEAKAKENKEDTDREPKPKRNRPTKASFRRITYWIYILTLFLAALLTCLHCLGWL